MHVCMTFLLWAALAWLAHQRLTTFHHATAGLSVGGMCISMAKSGPCSGTLRCTTLEERARRHHSSSDSVSLMHCRAAARSPRSSAISSSFCCRMRFTLSMMRSSSSS